jgi:hypothetical protein
VKPWKRFWFESNRFFDWVNGPEDWKRLMNEYPDKTEEWILERAKRATEHWPDFGLRREHKGPGTLKDFFEENGMEVPGE